ncbi:hypothetical protein [Brevibacterium sp. 2SA]|uniref:hypothetical protein n=1 Tax=Brevibacterium sp. 2SA TaxID=2502198 RepID=UPI0011262914|nr:hypothetical protein [Brevibacterium sp. 2SA]
MSGDVKNVAVRATSTMGRSALWTKGRRAAGRASATALSGSRVAWEASTAAVRQGRDAYTTASSLHADRTGRKRRPWEVVAAAILGLIAPLFIALAVIVMAVTGGRTLRAAGFALRQLGGSTGAEAVTSVGDVSTALANALVVVGIIVGLIVIVAFVVYAWRLLVGRGRARWIALAALIVSLFVLTPLSPILVTGFQLFGAASLVFAFLPRSSAWFAHRRRGTRWAAR